jgi:hypothetical protein
VAFETQLAAAALKNLIFSAEKTIKLGLTYNIVHIPPYLANVFALAVPDVVQ